MRQAQTSLPAITPFSLLSSKKGSGGQSFHLGRRRQAVRAELVHNAVLGSVLDSHSLLCVAVGQLPQQPGPIPLTYRYWFLFLGLRLVSFLMLLIYEVQSNIPKRICQLLLEAFRSVKIIIKS